MAGLILLVNAGFWVPMLVFWLKDSYHLHTLLEGGVRAEGATVMGLSQLFLHAGEVREGMAGLQINPVGTALMAAFLVFGGFILQRERKGSQERVVCIGLAIAILVSIVLALLDITEGIMAVTACLGGMFAAFLICYLQKEAKEIIYKGSLLTGILLTIMAAMYQVNDIAYEKAAVEVYTAENLVSTTALEREYLLQETYDAEVFYHEPVTSEGLLYENYQRNATTITMDVKNTTDGEAYLEVPLTGYWGYDVEGMLSDDKNEPYLTRERGAHGDLRLAVPAGYQGSIKIAYRGDFIFKIAEGISICSVLGCVIYGITKRKERSGHGCKEQKAL
ncbi:MAG: hypothetical protein IJF07_08580 [Lachnospiraceae bacterium]|nr:hypothetical protein [Lachnospiraceae bacterium]